MNVLYDDLSLTIGGTDHRNGPERLADRIRLVLETEPGTLPFAPTFGCDLSGIVGATASKARLSEARMRITAALHKWLPDVALKSVDIELIEPTRSGRRPVGVPIAERAMASRVVSQVLDIRIEVETPEGPVHFEAILSPGDSSHEAF